MWAPVFVIENPEKPYNKIGIPVVKEGKDSSDIIVIDPSIPGIFVDERHFETAGGGYSNLIYRIHFPGIPFDLIPFQLGAGKNVGLMVIVTLNSSKLPVLYTTVHTCGCYLAFIPTSYMPDKAFPANWPQETQKVYLESLPAMLDFEGFVADNKRIMVLLRNGSHRVRDIRMGNLEELAGFSTVHPVMQPIDYLERLPGKAGETISFYEESGSGRGYVKGSHKIWERLLMSWWAFDWRIGEDKKLGRNKDDPPVFYTSLKPWARDESDMRDFNTFLSYWGWNL